MKLSISNIAWKKENDNEIYSYLLSSKFDAIEIAPTRIFEENPYNHVDEAKEFAEKLYKTYNLKISSMQSIWYNKKERIFGSVDERESLIKYTKKAIDFAKAIHCNNLVFGSPKNRSINNVQREYAIAINFFNEIGDYASENGVCFSIEPNPVIYNTNFIVTTVEAINLVKDINNLGIKINLDLGTIIQNNENINIIKDNVNLINHVHISEPNLKAIKKRQIHTELIKILEDNNYQGYVSIEMEKQEDTQEIKRVIDYVGSLLQKG